MISTTFAIPNCRQHAAGFLFLNSTVRTCTQWDQCKLQYKSIKTVKTSWGFNFDRFFTFTWTGDIKASALEVFCLDHNSSVSAENHSAALSKTHLCWDALSYSSLHNPWRRCWHCSAPTVQHGATRALWGAGVLEHQWRAGMRGGGYSQFHCWPMTHIQGQYKNIQLKRLAGRQSCPIGRGW